MPRKGGKKAPSGLDDESLDALVEAIETEFAASSKKRSKEGMTKKQALALSEKKVNDAICKAQGNTSGIFSSEEQMKFALFTEQLLEQKALREAQYVNVFVHLKDEYTQWHAVSPKMYIRYEQFDGTDDAMNFIVDIFTKELSEPYSCFTYEYFVFGWPDLTLIAYAVESDTIPDSSVKGERVGAVVSRATRKTPDRPLRGYVAMCAVVRESRGLGLGSSLVALTVELMREKGCEEVYLETPVNNKPALSLYLNLGFVKTKFLPRYYLDHSDAVRLKLWIKNSAPSFAEEQTNLEIAN